MSYLNGNTRATSLDGRALRYLDARQRACMGANILNGPGHLFTTTLLANILHVSPAYIAAARKLSPLDRDGILSGLDKRSFSPFLKKKKNGNGHGTIDDFALLAMVREVGIERTLDAACLIEAAQ
jgi:hypothetical protein